MKTQYHDTNNNPISLHALCQTEPEWAAGRIEALTRLLDRYRDAVNGYCAGGGDAGLWALHARDERGEEKQ